MILNVVCAKRLDGNSEGEDIVHWVFWRGPGPKPSNALEENGIGENVVVAGGGKCTWRAACGFRINSSPEVSMGTNIEPVLQF